MKIRRTTLAISALLTAAASIGTAVVWDSLQQRDFARLHSTTLDQVNIHQVEVSHLHHLPGEQIRPGFHAHAGTVSELGTLGMPGFDVQVRQIGTALDRSVATFEFTLSNSSTPPEYLRAWIGSPDASVLVSDFQNPGAHTHLMANGGPGATLWVEYTTPSGTEVVRGVPIR